MPRGDLKVQYNKGMPPSHNCVWVEPGKNVTEKSFADNWDKVFGGNNTSVYLTDNPRCTCKFKESIDPKTGKGTITQYGCAIHPARQVGIKIGATNQGFSKMQKRKALKAITQYGTGKKATVQEVMYRK